MQLKINTIASKVFICQNVIIIILSLLLYLIIPSQFESHVYREKESALKQMNQMLSQHTALYFGHMASHGLTDVVKQELLNTFQTNPDFAYYALIPKQYDTVKEEPLLYNVENMGEAKELLKFETNETVIIEKAGMLNVITPLFNRHSEWEETEKKRGYLISGFSLKDQENELKGVKNAILLICGIFILFGNLCWYILYRYITTPLEKSTELVKNVVRGDLIGMVKSKSKDELGNLTSTLNTMVKTWREKVEKIKDVIKSSHSVSSEISIAADQQEKITAKQACSINEIAATIEELNTNSKLIHKKAEEVDKKSKKLLRVSLDDQKSVNKSIDKFALIREYVKNIAEYVLSLSEEVQQIGVILKEVSSIANQTDMLAINAGIRAAKVKERGKEFAIIQQ